MISTPEQSSARPIFLATRGSALALAQTNMVLQLCRAAFPSLQFELKVVKTTGDKLQTAPPDVPGMSGMKGLFTKELESALLNDEADMAVHSLKDLPTELPEGLELSAVLPRADVRDVLIYRDIEAFPPLADGGLSQRGRGLGAGATVRDFAQGATIATSSTRRQAQLLAARPDLTVIPIRGNVGTRLHKLADRSELDALVLAAAGLLRLQFHIAPDGTLSSADASAVPKGLRATFLSLEEMVPCVGQGAIGIEGRKGDGKLSAVFERLNDGSTASCVVAERAFLRAMGGGCLSPVAAHAEILGDQIRLRAVSFREAQPRRTERIGSVSEAEELGVRAAADVKD